jgi:hypothetical protein
MKLFVYFGEIFNQIQDLSWIIKGADEQSRLPVLGPRFTKPVCRAKQFFLPEIIKNKNGLFV